MKQFFKSKIKQANISNILAIIVIILVVGLFTFPALTLETSDVTQGNAVNGRAVNSGLTTVNTKDTNELITMNLYDYGYDSVTGKDINDKYHSSNYVYPGFVQGYGDGITGPISNGAAFNLGDTLTTDIKSRVAAIGTGINAYSSDSPLFYPLRNQMYPTLYNGYPAFGVSKPNSLEYLFNSKEGYAKKQNNKNISHLFQYDTDSETYYYSSKDNHAQFDAVHDKFIVYEQTITPNFMVYPFGNFLPLNDITTQTTKSSLINSDEIVNTYERAGALLASTKDPVLVSQYTKLGNSLINLHSQMGYGYTAEKLLNQYLSVAAVNDKRLYLTTPAKTKLQNNLPNLYSVDFEKETNFFFGFEMKFNFMQPKNGKTGKDNNQNMVFRFEGDDDVWVYIDDVLFLDLSGIHAQVGGEIDFSEGVVRYYGFDNKTYEVSTNEITAYRKSFESILGNNDKLNAKGTFNDYSTHTLTFYYMERGSSSSVMTTKFNMPLIKDHAITISKELASEDKNAIGDKDYYFQVLKPDNTLLVSEGYDYDVYDKNDNKLRSVKTAKNGIITLAAGEYAVVSGIKENAGKYYVRELIEKSSLNEFEDVLVDGKSKFDSSNSPVSIGGKEYIVVSSDTKDIADGNGAITFVNDINLGKLKIKKVLAKGTSDIAKDKEYKFYVTIDGTPLKVGTSYTVDGINYTVSELGIIKLEPGEEAVINKLIINSEFKVEEKLDSTSGLTDSYTVNGTSTDTDYASGKISATKVVEVVVTNAEMSGASIEIPVQKKTTNPDGVEYTYSFAFLDDKDEVIQIESIIVDKTGIGKEEAVFKVEYSQLEHSNKAETIYNYQIREEIDDDDKYTLYDTSIYDVQVKVTNNSSGFKATYTISKDGKEVDNIVFNNKILSSLTIEKIVDTVDGDNPNDGRMFNFIIESTGIPDGTYKTSGSDIKFKDGKATVALSHGKSITIYGLLYGIKYSVTETDKEGFVTMYNVDSTGYIEGDKVTNITLNKKNAHVSFVNVKGYELPQTGSSGMLIIASIVTVLISISSIYLLNKKSGEK